LDSFPADLSYCLPLLIGAVNGYRNDRHAGNQPQRRTPAKGRIAIRQKGGRERSVGFLENTKDSCHKPSS